MLLVHRDTLLPAGDALGAAEQGCLRGSPPAPDGGTDPQRGLGARRAPQGVSEVARVGESNAACSLNCSEGREESCI